MTKDNIILMFLRRAGAVPALTDAKVVPYDPAKRKSAVQRRARKAAETKRKKAEDRRRHNERVVKEYNLKKDKR